SSTTLRPDSFCPRNHRPTMSHIRLILTLHDHQPVGNFDHVFEQAYQDSYRRFLDVFEPYEHLKIALHTSGSLLQWLDAHHPDYLDRLARITPPPRHRNGGAGPF